jgi:hypothetical protein
MMCVIVCNWQGTSMYLHGWQKIVCMRAAGKKASIYSGKGTRKSTGAAAGLDELVYDDDPLDDDDFM